MRMPPRARRRVSLSALPITRVDKLVHAGEETNNLGGQDGNPASKPEIGREAKMWYPGLFLQLVPG